MRSGTLPVPLIVGFGKAAQLAKQDIDSGAMTDIRRLRDRLWAGLQSSVDGVHLNGSLEHRLPNNLNISIERVEGEALLMGIRRNVACSSGSACTSATLEPSYVLRAIGISDELAHSSIRFGVGRFNTEAEIDRAVEVVAGKVEELRAMSPMFG
jgi:cysteine desulfurase